MGLGFRSFETGKYSYICFIFSLILTCITTLQIPMNLFIMYMSGNTISIFPIMMIGMMLIRPIKAMFSTQVTSKMAEGAQGTGQKLVYFLGNLANVAVALYKCNSMGLLPTHASDWLAFVEPQTRIEYYGGGVSFI